MMREPESGLEAAALFAARAYKAVRRYSSVAFGAVGRAEARILGTKRRRLLSGALALVLVLAVVGTTAVVGTIDEQNRVAAAAAAQEKADAAEAKAEADAKTAKKAADAEALADAKASVTTVSDDAIAKSAAAPWADPAVLLEVEATRLALIETGKGFDTAAIQQASTTVQTALSKIGTIEDSQDRTYTAARAAAGRASITDAAATAKTARTYCTQLDGIYAADLSKSAGRFLEHWIGTGEDLQAIAVYCPQYQPVLDSLPSLVRDGKYSVGETATPYGVSPRTIAAGTYSMGPTQDCYWERSTGAGEIIDNDFVGNSTAGFAVSISSGEGFSASGCGTWTKQ